MQRYKGIIVTGALSGLVIITLLAAGLGDLRAVSLSGTAVPQQTNPVPQTTNLSAEEALRAWQQYSAELEQTVLTMQDRENTYQSQIDLANDTILQLQNEINTANSSAGRAFDDDDYEEHEDDDDHEEHEEHEEYERDDD